jgi:hypothetical protein
MSDHSMLGGARTGGRISIGSVLLDADERDKVRQMLFREGPVWLPAGRDLSHDRSAASRRDDRSAPLGIPRFNASVALSVVSAHKNSGTSSGMQLRSNVAGIRSSCAFLAANSLSIWQSPGGMDGN